MAFGHQGLSEYPKDGGLLTIKTGTNGMGSVYLASGTTNGIAKGGDIQWLYVGAKAASANNFSVGLYESGTNAVIMKLTQDSSLGVAGSYFDSRTPTNFCREIYAMVSGGTALGAGSFYLRMNFNPATRVR